MNDTGALEKIIDEVIAANPDNVAQFKAGKDKAFNALVGQAMKASKGKANPAQVNELLRRKLGAVASVTAWPPRGFAAAGAAFADCRRAGRLRLRPQPLQLRQFLVEAGVDALLLAVLVRR